MDKKIAPTATKQGDGNASKNGRIPKDPQRQVEAVQEDPTANAASSSRSSSVDSSSQSMEDPSYSAYKTNQSIIAILNANGLTPKEQNSCIQDLLLNQKEGTASTANTTSTTRTASPKKRSLSDMQQASNANTNAEETRSTSQQDVPTDLEKALSQGLMGTSLGSMGFQAAAAADFANAILSSSNAFQAAAAASTLGPPPPHTPPGDTPPMTSSTGNIAKPLPAWMTQGGHSLPSWMAQRKLGNGDAKTSWKQKQVTLPPDAPWEGLLQKLPRCTSAEGIRETSYFLNKVPQAANTSSSTRTTCLRKLLQEIGSLQQHLPKNPAVFVRFDEEVPQFLRALITAPPGTPYSLGLFCFDIYIPDSYPNQPPKMQLLTTGGGTVRFSPNLYQDGKVCLSLLNTWNGPKWNANHSTLLQVLVSIQALILGVEHPYYLEPGHGGWEGQVKEGSDVPAHVRAHEDRYRVGTIKFALLETLKEAGRPRHLQPFQQVIQAHFYHYRHAIVEATLDWKDNMKEFQVRQIKQHVADLQEELDKLQPPSLYNGDEEATDLSLKEAPASTTNGSRSGKRAAVKAASEEQAVATSKRRAMEEAASNKDYVAAGRLQLELQHLEAGGIEFQIATKRKEMQEAASKQDYITAGQLQVVVQHLEENKQLLQDLERRMFGAAAKLDFVRAGRFQEQHRILLNVEDSSNYNGKTIIPSSQNATVSGGGAMGPPIVSVASGMGPPPGAMFAMGHPFGAGPPPPASFYPEDAGVTYDEFGPGYYDY